jgi:TPR repeat protein
LGTLYHYGKGVEADSEKAIEYYKRAVEQGNPEYQCALGKLYEDGKLFENNLLEALKWYTKAYIQGYNDIRQRLYDMYEHEPYEYYFFKRMLQNLLVASCGHFRLNNFYPSDVFCDVNSRIGALYFFGQGTDKDLGKGWDYLSMEYSMNSGRENTDFLFIESNSLDSNQKSYILNAIEENDTIISQMGEKLLYTLGMHFFEGVLKIRNEYTTLEYYDQDNSNQHIIIERNYTKASRCLKKAANENYPPAIHQLGIMYRCGYGVDKDIGQGEEYFNEVVNDDPEYMKSIAMLYHTHDGMQNFTKAFQWYKRYEEWLDEDSKGSGHKVANDVVQAGLGLLYEYGDGVKQDYQKAIEYYQNLVNNNTRLGFHRMGLMYYYGKGVLVDYQKALNLFEETTSAFSEYNDKLPFVYPQTDSHTDGNQNSLVFVQ